MKIVAGFMFNYLLTFYSQWSALATTAESFLFHSTLFTDIKKKISSLVATLFKYSDSLIEPQL